MLGKRGYIGPLGDDFPSIFPLMLGLIIFFSTLSLAYTAYQAKNDTVQTMRANLMISRAVRYQIYFDEDYWSYACQLALALRGNYQTHLAMWIEYEGDKGWRLGGVCPSEDSREFWEKYLNTPSDVQNILLEKTRNRQASFMTYPVIWKGEEGANKPARLVVVTWR